MRAMILAAGLGTRLRPLTETTPKALIEVNGRSILEIIVLRLKKFGFKDIIVNVHHHHKQIIEFINYNDNFGINIQISDESDQILDTGGGIKKASWFLEGPEPFLVHNVDVISNINLKEIYDFHMHMKPMATLAVKDKGSDRSLLFDDSFRLCGWENRDTGESKIMGNIKEKDRTRIGFCGIHVIDPLIYRYMDKKEKFSIINTYMDMATDQIIYGYPVEDKLWIDIGSFKQLEYAQTIAPEEYLN